MIGLLTILSIYTIIGALGIVVISRKRPLEKKRLYAKYITYIVLLSVLTFSILKAYPLMIGICLVILSAGIFEIIRGGIKGGLSRRVLLTSILIYALASLCFGHFILFARPSTVFFFYAHVIVFDGFSQLSGQIIPSRRISKVSPGKTLAGLIGGSSITICSFIIFGPDFLPIEHFQAATWALIFCLFCYSGDLIASGYKRICGLKDFGRILPGTGGILDRFDSFIAVGSYYWLINLSAWN